MSKKSKIINSIIVVASVIILVCYVLFTDGLENILNVFSSCNPIWLLGGACLMVIYWYLEGHILNMGVGFYGKKLTAKQCAKNTMIGQFFNSITPSATGGQPMQAYYMTKCGISVGFATSSLLIRFIAYQISLTIFSALILIFKYHEFSLQIPQFSILIFFGFTINTLVAAMLLLIGFNKKMATSIMHFFVKALAKIRIIKDKEQKLEKVDSEVEKFHKGFESIFTHKREIAFMFLFSFLQLIAFFSVNVTIAGAFGVPLSINQIFILIASVACVQMSSAFIPLPGAAGGAELSYFILCGNIFGPGTINAAMLMWRLFTFYFPIIVGLFFARDIFGKKETNKSVKA